MPSSRWAVRLLGQNLPKGYRGEVYELGAGWGGVTRVLAKKMPQAKIIAYENSLIPYLVTYFRTLALKNVSVKKENFFRKSFFKRGVFFCYLYPKAMEAIATLGLKGEVFSNSFRLPGEKPTKIYRKQGLFTPCEIFHYCLD